MPLTQVLLVRHGETDWNRDGRVMGRRSIPLNANGHTQVRKLASMLQQKSIDGLCSSPVLRAHQTATILAESLRCPVHIEPDLAEIAMGEWEALYWKDLADDLNRRNLYSAPDEARPPGGETLKEVQARAVNVIERLRNTSGSQVLIFVTHADVVRAILSHYLNFELRRIRQVRIDPASVSAIELHLGLADLLYLNVSPFRDGQNR
jgi:broad specificity phosphatase PhoE